MDTQKQTFEAALADFIAEINRVSNRNHEQYTNLPQGRSEVVATRGPKYTKLVHSVDGLGGSYYGFVRNVDGIVFYAGGPKPFIGKTEAATGRGNIFDATTWGACIGPYGVKTLNRR